MLALEAGAVEDDAVGGELVHRVHRLGAHLALLLRPAKHLPPEHRSTPPSVSVSRRPARSERPPIRPWPARAWDGERTPPGRPDCRVYIRRRQEHETRLSEGVMTGSSPPTRPRAPHFCRGGKEKAAANKRRRGMGIG